MPAESAFGNKYGNGDGPLCVLIVLSPLQKTLALSCVSTEANKDRVIIQVLTMDISSCSPLLPLGASIVFNIAVVVITVR